MMSNVLLPFTILHTLLLLDNDNFIIFTDIQYTIQNQT